MSTLRWLFLVAVVFVAVVVLSVAAAIGDGR